MSNANMTGSLSRRVGLALLMIMANVPSGRSQSRGPTAPPADCTRPIANVAHGDVHFTVSIDRSDNRLLALVVPEKQGSEPRPVRIRVRLRDESAIEGVADRQPSVSSGGFVDWRYRFDLKRPLLMPNIFSVTIWVGDQMFEVFPW